MKKLLALALCMFCAISYVSAEDLEVADAEATTEEVAEAEESDTIDAQQVKKLAQEEKSSCSSCAK